MENKRDVFDRMFETKILSFANPFYHKYKEQLLYLFFGALTTVISIGVFWLFTEAIPVGELIANAISWFAAVLFAFITNRTWVFSSSPRESFGKQMLSFYGGRVATLLVEEGILAVFVTWLRFDSMLIKVIGQVIVLVLNYLVSKWIVFRKK